MGAETNRLPLLVCPQKLSISHPAKNVKFTVGANIVRPHATKPFPKNQNRRISQTKNLLTNAAFWRIIKIKREHTSRRSAPTAIVKNLTAASLDAYGRLFLFLAMVILITIFMIIVNV